MEKSLLSGWHMKHLAEPRILCCGRKQKNTQRLMGEVRKTDIILPNTYRINTNPSQTLLKKWKREHCSAHCMRTVLLVPKAGKDITGQQQVSTAMNTGANPHTTAGQPSDM